MTRHERIKQPREYLNASSTLTGENAVMPIIVSNGSLASYQAENAQESAVEALVTGEPGSPTYQWQGVCWYRRTLEIPADSAGKKVFLKFDGAMNVADVFLDGEPLGTHLGGYLPFVFDITDRVRPGADHLLAVRLDNTDNAITGPKPLAILDFNMYGGLYRHVHLIVKDRLHITDPIHADRIAGGGVFVRYPEVAPEQAVILVRTHVRNDYDESRRFLIHHALIDERGHAVYQTQRPHIEIAAHDSMDVELELRMATPSLWSPRSPNLYTLRTEIRSGGAFVDGFMDPASMVDRVDTRIGIRRISITPERGFEINGEPMFLRGTNRHQEYPYIGYAVPDAAQWRDAKRIKEAGFDYVRLSHYPQSPAFMDACDELGLVVMNAIPGWQYFGDDPGFTLYQYRNVRELIRRDRNHACVALWEVSLNETAMPAEFVAEQMRQVGRFFAPQAARKSHISCTCGSHAALTICEVPFTVSALRMKFSVVVTEAYSSHIRVD